MRLIAAALLCCAVSSGQAAGLGSRVGDLKVETLEGSQFTVSPLRGKATVVAFISTLCPVSNAFNDRMSALFNEYSAKGVQFVFVNSNANETTPEVSTHHREAGFPFAVYRDPKNHVADQLGAASTPETYVLDGEGVVRYHGFIEDSPNEARAKKRALRAALDAVLAGSSVAVPETKAFGCTIKRVKRAT